jgi:hypothetical protein
MEIQFWLESSWNGNCRCNYTILIIIIIIIITTGGGLRRGDKII